MKYISDYLSCLFDDLKEYSCINNYRSALSAFHDPIEGFSVGKHPLWVAQETGSTCRALTLLNFPQALSNFWIPSLTLNSALREFILGSEISDLGERMTKFSLLCLSSLCCWSPLSCGGNSQL